MTADNPQSETGPTKSRAKMLRYHEAGHAVLMWNLGIEVDRVVANQESGGGYVMPALERPERYDITRRIADIVASLAGGVAHRCFQQGAEKEQIHCSGGDLKNALNVIATLGDLPPGAEVYLFKALLIRTIQIVDMPEVQTQIR